MGKEGHSVGEKAARVGSDKSSTSQSRRTKGGLASSAKCSSTVESEHKMCRYCQKRQRMKDTANMRIDSEMSWS